MNHPIHPEDVTFAGLVMGRVIPSNPGELKPALGMSMFASKADYDAAQAALAAPVAAQPETSNLALQELTTLIRHHTDPEAFQEIRQALLAFNQTAQPGQPAVPVTEAEARRANSVYVAGSMCGEGAMRAALEAFLASRGQA